MKANENFNVFYILGAGASIGSNKPQKKIGNNINNKSTKLEQYMFNMPLADNFNKVLKNILIIYETLNLSREKSIYKKDKVNIEVLKTSVTEFEKFIKKYNTVDEGMRNLYLFKNKLENQSNYDIFKKAISTTFFIIENYFNLEKENRINAYRDNRYSQFLLTLLNNDFSLPSNIKILSWNYDNQFELAIKDINKNFYSTQSPLTDLNYLKLNGTAYDCCEFSYKQNFINILEIIYELFNKESLIKFSWEDSCLHEEFIKKHLQLTNKQTVFVYIGYSAPYINNLIDNEIINKIKPYKVYFQNPSDEDFIKFKDIYTGKIPEANILHIKNTSRFYIPPELHVGYTKGSGVYNFQ